MLRAKPAAVAMDCGAGALHCVRSGSELRGW